MEHSITVMMSLLLLISSLGAIQCKAILQARDTNTAVDHNSNRQFLFLTGAGGETTAPDFIRLVVMRFIYGMAATMGVEERLEGLFNGAFVPPNADYDFFGLGGLGDSEADSGGLTDEDALEGIFTDDAF